MQKANLKILKRQNKIAQEQMIMRSLTEKERSSRLMVPSKKERSKMDACMVKAKLFRQMALLEKEHSKIVSYMVKLRLYLEKIQSTPDKFTKEDSKTTH